MKQFATGQNANLLGELSQRIVAGYSLGSITFSSRGIGEVANDLSPALQDEEVAPARTDRQ